MFQKGKGLDESDRSDFMMIQDKSVDKVERRLESQESRKKDLVSGYDDLMDQSLPRNPHLRGDPEKWGETINEGRATIGKDLGFSWTTTPQPQVKQAKQEQKIEE